MNSPRAAAQVIEGEAVLIDFDRGHYYSSLGTGGEVVRLLELGYTVEQIVDAFQGRYADQVEDTGGPVRAFVAELLREHLFSPVESEPSPERAERLELSALDFSPPELERYTDLDDLLMLDPIHDVDPAGWPLREADEGR